MAVALSGYTQGVSTSKGYADMAWPAGAQVNHLAVAIGHDGKGKRTNRPVPSNGWKYHGRGIWTKIIVASDLDAPLRIKGRTIFLLTFSGAAKGGKFTAQGGVKINPGGGAALIFGRRRKSRGVLTATQTKLGDDVITVQPSGKVRHNLWVIESNSVKYVRIKGDPEDQWYNSLEIVPQQEPFAPTIIRPKSDRHIAYDSETLFRWRHNSAQGVEQEAFSLRVRESGTTDWYYLTGDGTLSASYVEVVQSAQEILANANLFTLGEEYEWQVGTREVGTYMSDWSVTAQFLAMARPEVTSITVTIPAEDLSPEVTWVADPYLANVLTAWRVRIRKITGEVVWYSGVIPGSGNYVEVPSRSDWENGGSYYATVGVQQSGGLWSEETYSVVWQPSWTPPPAPIIVASNQTDGPLQLTITGIDPTAVTLEIRAGSETIMIIDDLAGATSRVVDIPQAPYGVETVWSARISTTLDDAQIYSAWAYDTLASTDTGCYLIDGTDYLRTVLFADGERVFVQGVAVWYGLDSSDPATDRGPVQGETGTTTVLCHTAAATSAMVEWLTTRDSWYLRWPPERHFTSWNRRPPLVNVEMTRMTQATTVRVNRPESGALTERTVQFSWVSANG